MKQKFSIRTFPFEPVIWSAGLLALALITPGAGHFTVCPLALSGITWCPGCGLGASVSHLLHGNLAASLDAHILGVPAVVILVHRIIQSTITFIRKEPIHE